MSSRLAWTLALGAVCTAAGTPSSASACTSLPVVLCNPGSFFPASGTLPANALQWSWSYPYDPAAPEGDGGVVQPKLFVDVNGLPMELDLSQGGAGNQVLSLAAGQTPEVGSVLELGYSFGCGETVRVQSTITVGPAAPLPTTLGTLEPAPNTGTIEVGACNESIDAGYVDLSIRLSPDATPYRDALQYRLLVDGQASALNASFIPTTDTAAAPNLAGALRVFAACQGPIDGTADLRLGRHRVQAVATLPDGSTVMSAEQEVDLRCDVVVDAAVPGTGPDASTEGAAPTTRDAGLDAAATPTRPTSDGGLQTAPSDNDDGCALHGGANGGWLALALGLLLARKKRG